MAEGIATMCRK